MDNLKLTEKINITATILDPSAVINPNGSIHLRSKGTFYLNINTGGE